MSYAETRYGNAVATVYELEEETNSLRKKLVDELETERYEKNKSKNKEMMFRSLKALRGSDVRKADL